MGWAHGCYKLELSVLRNHALAQLCGGNTLYSVLKLVIGNTKTLIFDLIPLHGVWLQILLICMIWLLYEPENVVCVMLCI